MEALKRIDWNGRAEHALQSAFRYEEDLQDIRAEVQRESSTLWRAGDSETYVVMRIEDKELVIVAITGINTKEVMRSIYTHAWEIGFKSIRFHTQNLAMIRLLKEFSPEPIEYVMRIFPDGRQKQV